MPDLTSQQELNIHGGETWRRGAERMYGGKLPGLGAVIEYGPQKQHGVDTLMHVSGLGWVGESFWDAVNSPGARRLSALLMLYHGYKRTGSIGWAAFYAAFGFAIPPAAAVVAAVQLRKQGVF